MRWSDPRRQNHTIVVRMSHNDSPDQSRADTPTGRPRILLRACPRYEFDLRSLRKVLPEKVGRSGLNRFAILNHRFDAQSLNCAGETFALGLLAVVDRHCKVVPGKS